MRDKEDVGGCGLGLSDERMVVCVLSLDVRPIACSCKKSYDKVITRVILSHPRTTLACSHAPAAY